MIEIQKELCIGCGACVKDCPGKALAIEEGKAVYKRECVFTVGIVLPFVR